MIADIINQICLAGFNFINSRIDAYRILRNKTIAHGINFSAYTVFALILYWLTKKPDFTWAEFPYFNFIAYCVSAFCNRQFSFDIPLNLRRHLSWNYVTSDRPPKALLDRIEVKIFGYNGTTPFIYYGIVWIVSLIKILFNVPS